MRPVVITQTNTGATVPVPLDLYIAPFMVTVRCKISGAPVYSLQYTYDNVFETASGSIDWLTASDVPVGTAVSVESVFDNPVSAIRMVIASVGAPTDSVKMTVNQAGIV
jgi:hypothetical protein